MTPEREALIALVADRDRFNGTDLYHSRAWAAARAALTSPSAAQAQGAAHRADLREAIDAAARAAIEGK